VCEKAIKIALILGIPDGLITVEHVKWAMAASMRDAEEKVSAITIEDKSFSKADKLLASIMKAVKNNPGQTMAWISTRSAIIKYGKEEAEKAVNHLVARGDILVEDSSHKKTGEIIKRYRVK